MRGDIDYAGQLDDDFADFVAAVRSRQPNAKLVLMGFSSGGGYALHVAASPLGKMFVRTVMLSPMLGPFAPTINPDQKYAGPFIPRIIALVVLNRVGIHAFDHLTTLLLAIDPARTDILVGHYSWLLMRAIWQHATTPPMCAMRKRRSPSWSGERTSFFTPTKFAPTLAAIKPRIPVTIVPGLSHTGLTTDPRASRPSSPPCAAPAPHSD